MNEFARQAGSIERADNGLGESAHRFGTGLIGVLSRPRGGAPSTAARTAVILLNAGLVHRAGPFRGYVQLARALNASGFAVLRFDQSGLGDSPVSPLASAERRLGEVQAAMALLQAETGAEQFVLGGICSGADDAFHLAVGDERVVGTVLLDGLAHRTAGFWLRHLWPRLLDSRRLWTALRNRSAHQPGLDDYRDFPPRALAARQMAQLVARDVRMLFIYTGGAYRYFNHRGQLAACLGKAARAPQVSLQHWRDCDHTFYLRQDRLRMQQAVTAWMQAQFDGNRGGAMP